MKKMILTATVLAFLAGAVQAQSNIQSNVSIYGILDSGIEHVTNIGLNKDSVTRMPGLTGSLPSRLGFRGSEDLGGGLKAALVLESGLSLDTGTSNQSGRLFGRQAYVSIGGAWGAVSFGRQYSQIYWGLGEGYTMGPNIYAAALLDTYMPNARLDNAVAYRGKFGGLTVGATVSLGRDNVAAVPAGGCPGESATDSKACRTTSGLLQYDFENWGVTLSAERQYGGAGAGSPLPLSSQTDTRKLASGYVKVAGATIGGGLLHRINEGVVTPKSDFWWIGGTYPIDALVFDIQYGHIDVKNSANDANVIAARVMYNFSKRSAVYLNMGKMNNHGLSNFTVDGGVVSGAAPMGGVGQTGVMVGLRHIF